MKKSILNKISVFSRIDSGKNIIDIIKAFKKVIKKAKTIVWNGPVGVYEFEKFKKGTIKVAKQIAKSKAMSIIGGGDSVAAIQDLGICKKVTHLSTGGGASLMLLQGKQLPCLELIEELQGI